MEKKFSLDQLDKTSPLRVPEGYFETLTSRVMAAIPEEEPAAVRDERKDGKVVGMIPRKSRQGRKTWVAVAAAACVCGAVFFLTRPSDQPELQQPLAQTTPAAPAVEEEEVVTTVSVKDMPETKVYANASYDLNQRGRRTAAASTAPTYQMTANEKAAAVVATANNEVPQPKVTPAALMTTTPAKSTGVAKSEPASSLASIDIPASDVDKFVNECDIIDYTQMGGSDILDYLSGIEYY